MTKYRVKEEYYDLWQADSENYTVTEQDLDCLANQWRKVEDGETAEECKAKLLEQLEVSN